MYHVPLRYAVQYVYGLHTQVGGEVDMVCVGKSGNKRAPAPAGAASAVCVLSFFLYW